MIQPSSTPTQRMIIFRATLLLAALTTVVGLAPLHSQDLSIRAGVGAAMPVGGADVRRDAGPAVMLSVEYWLDRVWSIRFDGERSSLNARSAPAEQEAFSQYQDLRTQGVSVNGIARYSDAELAPYLLVGIGAYQLQVDNDRPNPYGTTGAVQAGIGVERNVWSLLNLFAEARAQAHLTDYGSGDSSATVYWPLLIGLRIGSAPARLRER